MQILLWILGSVATYRLWGNHLWLSVIVIILVLSYQVSPEENNTHKLTGSYDNITANRLAMTFALVAIIFVYSLFK